MLFLPLSYNSGRPSPTGVTINRTGPQRASTRPEITDYFILTTVTSRIKA